jgi:hypothetical protein
MKYTHACPKCHSTDIVRVPGHVGAYGSGSHIRKQFRSERSLLGRRVVLRAGRPTGAAR